MTARAEKLRGKTVVVTRPRTQSAGLVRSLEASGARVIAAPLIRTGAPRSFKALDRGLRSLGDFDCVVFASRNAVLRFFARARALRLGRLAAPGRVFAVGPETARALRSFGWKPFPVPGRHDGASLARAIKDVRGRRILIPRAAAGRDDLPRILRRRGALVTAVDAYRTLGDAAGAKRLRALARRRVDAVTFTSPSTVDNFVAALGAAEAKRLLGAAAAVSIGPVTSAALRRLGLRPLQASQATPKGLVEALARGLRS